jgi:bifunctional DNase/RNase
MPRMIEVIVESVRVSLTNQHRIVVLREKNGDRHLPIWIGAFEAESITLALQEIEVARPQTHDLLKNTIQALNGRLVRIEIVSLKDDVFYGNLIIDVNGEFIFVDCRPSDAIALAIRCRVPILMSSEIMEVAGFIPEQEIDANATEESTEMIPDEQPEENVDRLSVFEDFLETLEPKEPGDKEDEDSEPPADDQPDPDKPQK